jgi:hypothetical protein
MSFLENNNLCVCDFVCVERVCDKFELLILSDFNFFII